MAIHNLKYIIGAYATAPSLGTTTNDIERKYYKKLVDDIPEIKGLEVPFLGHNIHPFGSKFLFEVMQPSWDNVLTCIPGTMGSLSKNPAFGLASDDIHGRAEAVAMHKRANIMLHRMNNHFGKKSIFSVQIATAPSVPVNGITSSLDSFLQSMDEMLIWDWAGAKLVIEHCDTFVLGQGFEKGFLSIEKELEAFETLSKEHSLGVTINWARSAIEGRNIQKPIDHLNLVMAKNLLSGLIFSGVSNNDKKYGRWNDTHVPFAKIEEYKFYEKNSLLTLDNIKNTLNVVNINKLDYLGIKLLAMPINNSTLERRVGLNRDAVSILNQVVLNMQV